MRDIRPIQDRIKAEEFENVLPYPSGEVLTADVAYQALDKEESQLLARVEEIRNAKKALRSDMRIRYDEESTVKRDAFRAALELEYGLVEHPKRLMIWQKAWEDGHSGGWSVILSEYDELFELLSL